MNRREAILGASAVAAATALPAAKSASGGVEYVKLAIDPAKQTQWTYCYIVEGGPLFPFGSCGYVMHKPDLSDLGEPYLSAVRAAQADNKLARGIEV